MGGELLVSSLAADELLLGAPAGMKTRQRCNDSTRPTARKKGRGRSRGNDGLKSTKLIEIRSTLRALLDSADECSMQRHHTINARWQLLQHGAALRITGPIYDGF